MRLRSADQLVAQIKAQAPLCHIEIHPLSAESDYHGHLAQGEVVVTAGVNRLREGQKVRLLEGAAK